MITDGSQTKTGQFTPLTIASQGIKNKGVTVYAVGVGKGAVRSELLEIASGPGNVLSTSSFEELQKIASELRRQFCEGNYNWCTGTSTLVPEIFFSRVTRSFVGLRPKTRASKPRGHFLRLHRNRKPRMKSLWHPG